MATKWVVRRPDGVLFKNQGGAGPAFSSLLVNGRTLTFNADEGHDLVGPVSATKVLTVKQVEKLRKVLASNKQTIECTFAAGWVVDRDWDDDDVSFSVGDLTHHTCVLKPKSVKELLICLGRNSDDPEGR